MKNKKQFPDDSRKRCPKCARPGCVMNSKTKEGGGTDGIMSLPECEIEHWTCLSCGHAWGV